MAALSFQALPCLGSLQVSVVRLDGQQSSRTWGPVQISASSSTLQFPALEYQSSDKMLRAGERHKLDLQKVAKGFQTHVGDTGSSQVQVALLTAKIKYLSDHLLVHKKDFASRRGLKAMIARRKKLLLYLRSEDESDYRSLIQKLGIRELKKAA
eukprot:TRINITY_DN853_c0_g1_i2.p1 TRINITY_DN853_c0_g1~~TRINITY_DN853_c0_g1_i2.p1  ORF type:complete len:154 (+),score=19.06 TRINITY_DN853_c0_g1_i2:56-517(+)